MPRVPRFDTVFDCLIPGAPAARRPCKMATRLFLVLSAGTNCSFPGLPGVHEGGRQKQNTQRVLEAQAGRLITLSASQASLPVCQSASLPAENSIRYSGHSGHSGVSNSSQQLEEVGQPRTFQLVPYGAVLAKMPCSPPRRLLLYSGLLLVAR